MRSTTTFATPPPTTPRWRMTIVLVALAIAVAACGGEATQGQATASASSDDGNEGATNDDDRSSDGAGEDEAADGAPDDDTDDSDDSDDAEPGDEEPGDEEDEGEDVDPEPDKDDDEADDEADDVPYSGPAAGSELDVIAVAYDASLTVRSAPNDGASAVTTIPETPGGPTAATDDERPIVAAGEAATSGGTTWYRITVDGADGWAPAANLAMLADATDISADVEAEISSPRGVDLQDVAAAAIDTRGYGNDIEVTYVTEPLYFEGVGAFAFIDLTGLGDDSVLGERLRVAVTLDYGDTVDDDEPVVEAVFLDTVEATPICARGVSGGLCL